MKRIKTYKLFTGIELAGLLCFVVFSCSSMAQRLSVSGQRILKPDNDSIVFKGFNWGIWDSPQATDALSACAMGANLIRIPFRWYFSHRAFDIRDTTALGNISSAGLTQLDQYVNWCSQNNIWIDLFGGSDLGAGDSSYNFWTNMALRQQFVVAWKFLAARYKNTPYFAGYEILSEPHPRATEPESQVRGFYQQLIDSVRTVDSLTPFIIGPNYHYKIAYLDSIYLPIPNIIYTVDFFEPSFYCQQTTPPQYSYPGVYTISSVVTNFNKHYLDSVLQPVVNFRNLHNVPVFVDQYGVHSYCPGYLQYTSDAMSVFKNNNTGFCFWTYREPSPTDSLQQGLYWQDSSGVYHVKQALYDTLITGFGQAGQCSVVLPVKLLNSTSNIKISVYPNPSTSSFTITFPEDMSSGPNHIVVDNLLGQQVFNEDIVGVQTTTLDLGGLKPSVYILTIYGINKTLTQKLVKTN